VGDEDSERASKNAVYNVDVEISVILGETNLRVSQLLKLGRGAIVELEQKTDQPVEVYANGHLIARGEVVVTTGDKVGVSITEIVKSIFTT